MHETTGLSQALQDGGRPGLLAEYGISVEGTPEALIELRLLLAGKPIGRAMVLIAEQGRHYGVRLFATSQFDEQQFLQNAARFGMNGDEAVIFALNLRPQPGSTPKLSADIRPLRLDRTLVQQRSPEQ
ncbi:hypothetical protein [Hephaestia caeni]|uniref:hypothetical protein n=1 Tax=Hephaestia caeni TaxID=645617 RepID=UPI0011C35145|nr:hypothetical protein [Hephaestia caeni]